MVIEIVPPIILMPPPATAENMRTQKMPSFVARLGKPDAAIDKAEIIAAMEMTVPVLAISLNHSIPPMK
jgi:hypothetical protein